MITAADLPDVIPVFPLPGALLLPRARLPLQIFEPRYLAMLEDTLKTSHRLIGMVQPQRSDDRGLCSVGCAGRVTGFSETDDGRYMISLSGVSRYRISSEINGFAPYRRCNVQWGEFGSDLGAPDCDVGFQKAQFLPLLSRYFEDQGLSTDWGSLKDAGPEVLINSLAMLCPFEPEDKQALLEAKTLTERRKTLVTLIEFALLGGSGEEIMQ